MVGGLVGVGVVVGVEVGLRVEELVGLGFDVAVEVV